jgi:hypothetical protein
MKRLFGVIQLRRKLMITQNVKIVVLTLILFFSCYSQEEPSSIGDMRGRSTYKPKGSGISKKINIRGDTLKLGSHETYALFSGVLLEIIYPHMNFGIKSIIRGDIDTANYSRSIVAIYNFLLSCPDNKFETNKNYLVLNVFMQGKDSPFSPYENCENILPDTPENREILVKKYEKTIIIKKNKPGEAKKE